MRFQRPLTVCLLILSSFSLLCLSGCGGKKVATVSGKVTFNGKSLTAGNIAFVGKTGIGHGTIKQDGSYVVPNVPVGEVTITIETPPPRRGGMAGMMDAPKAPSGVPAMPKEMIPADYQEKQSSVPVVPAPEKYSKVETSPLKYTVKSGKQEYKIDLQP